MSTVDLTVRLDERIKKYFDTGVLDQTVTAEMKHAVKSMRELSVTNGNSEMSLDDINEEINAARLVGILR